LLFFQNGLIRIKNSIDLGRQLVEGMNTASKEVVCFKTIMQHSLVYAASSAISCIRAPETFFWNTVLAALNIFLQ
jgi:hypothetical protein